jgi:dTDP-4-dehydrorhamnose reductase
MNILVLGVTGMLGNAVFRVLSEDYGLKVFGTVRQKGGGCYFISELASRLIEVEDIESQNELEQLFSSLRPDVVINCIAVRKPAPTDLLKSINIYSLLPHRLAHLCRLHSARMIQISTDGVFSGSRGLYSEDDFPDASDLYGISKILGEIREPHAITLRTSIIGHELQTKTGLLEWFLSQQKQCRCYTRSIFSGFPTVVLAKMIKDIILPRPDLNGIYHVATKPTSKFDLLKLVAQKYGKSVNIVPDDKVFIDRSLSADKFESATGYSSPDWPSLIDTMHSYKYGLAGH